MSELAPHAHTLEALHRAYMILRAYREKLPPVNLDISPDGHMVIAVRADTAEDGRRGVNTLAALLNLCTPYSYTTTAGDTAYTASNTRYYVCALDRAKGRGEPQ